ncbi:LysR family transcriptional regulator [Ramlibacter sp.]|uniref:LysR family transcriptional regulator n=1 Tax=Ramlibacter sp. TaxID=1917967 RepID=UPI00178D3987|nr:LysR family transcriptional regulator [Ramlibacter sp.]MBA2676317.1 LysR family transcriptional regulator [Ramlibacter sp.]
MDATHRVRAMLSFVQAADHGSFAAAARSLGISAAAVGKNVAGLEGALGVRLMNRSTRSLQLTGEGQAFLERARDAIQALDLAIDTVAAQRAAPAGRVRISVSNAFGHRYVLPLLPGLVKRHPALVPELDFDDRQVDIVRGGYDIAIRGGRIADSSLVSRRICDLHTVLVASPAYLKAHGTPARPDELRQHRLIAVRYLNGTTSPWSLRKAPGAPVDDWLPEPPALVVSDPWAVVEAAAAGMGIAQSGAHHAWPYLQAGKLKVLLPRHHDSGRRAMVLQYPHRALVAPRVKATVDYLLEQLQRHPALCLTLAQLRGLSA